MNEQWFDIIKLLKVFGVGLLHFLLLNLARATWLPLLAVPLATIVTGERYASSYWLHGSSMLLLLLCYGFFIGKSDKGYRITHVLLQCSLYTACTILMATIVPISLYVIAITVAGTVGSLTAGALIGCCFVSNKVKPVKVKKAGFKAVASTGARIAIGIMIGLGVVYLLMSLGTIAQGTLYVGKPTPETPFATASGETWTFEAHKGKVILVEFWAPYCGPCVAAFPELNQTHERFSQHEDFEMVSVTSPSMEEWAIEMFEDKQAPWTLLFRPEEAGPNDLAPYSIPAAYIIDRDGKIVAAHIRGAAVERELEKLFDV